MRYAMDRFDLERHEVRLGHVEGRQGARLIRPGGPGGDDRAREMRRVFLKVAPCGFDGFLVVSLIGPPYRVTGARTQAGCTLPGV